MKKNSIHLIALLLITTLLSSCEVIGAIFKTGMGVGIFIVVAIIGIIIAIMMKIGKNKNS